MIASIVSVIIPTFNREKTIERAVRSALNQSVPVEVLVCDDGSTDNTMKIIESINDPRIRIIKGKRAGRPAVPRNRGIKAAKGEWIAFLDSDDEWLPDKLEKQFDVIRTTHIKAVVSNAYTRIPDKGLIGKYASFHKKYIDFDDLLYGNPVICSSMLIQKSLLRLVNGFPEDKELSALEDYALWLRITTQTKLAYIKEPLLIYNDDIKTSIRKKDLKTKRILFEQRRLIFKSFLEWAKMQNIRRKFLKSAHQQYSSALKCEIFRQKTLKDHLRTIIKCFKK